MRHAHARPNLTSGTYQSTVHKSSAHSDFRQFSAQRKKREKRRKKREKRRKKREKRRKRKEKKERREKRKEREKRRKKWQQVVMACHHLRRQPIVVGVNFAICSLTNHVLSITAMEDDDLLLAADLADVRKSKHFTRQLFTITSSQQSRWWLACSGRC